MKYMLLIYDAPDTREIFSGEQGKELMAQMTVVMDEIRASGEYVATQGLADAANAKTVRLQDGQPAITDGPFAEAKEQLGGYVIVDCEHERALELARRWPLVSSGGIEVRPVMFDGGAEM